MLTLIKQIKVKKYKEILDKINKKCIILTTLLKRGIYYEE